MGRKSMRRLEARWARMSMATENVPLDGDKRWVSRIQVRDDPEYFLPGHFKYTYYIINSIFLQLQV